MKILVTGTIGFHLAKKLLECGDEVVGLDNINDYDGTGVRDYIHVVDLAIAHIKALDYLYQPSTMSHPLITNIGTGVGYSVLDVVKAFEKVSGQKVPHEIADKRAGDIAKCYADPSYAKKLLGWEATKTLEDMCRDSWRWQSSNSNGYKGS